MSGYPYARGSFYPSVPPVPSTAFTQPRPVNPPPPVYNPPLPGAFTRQGFYPPSNPYVTPNCFDLIVLAIELYKGVTTWKLG